MSHQGRFTSEFLDAIRDRVRLTDIVSPHVALKRAGREFKGLSPFKTEKTPSFTVVPEKGFYHCFASGEHGDVIDFVMKVEGLTFPEAVEKLAARAGLDMPDGRQPRAPKAAKAEPATPPPEPQRKPDTSFVRRVWGASESGDHAPIRRRFTALGLWHPAMPLPGDVRWLTRDRAEAHGIRLNGWPDDAAGAIIYLFRRRLEPVAVQAEALTIEGERRHWKDANAKRKSLGRARGASFRLPAPESANRVLHVAESPSTALAVRTWLRSPVWCSAGASTLAALADDLARTAAAAIVVEADDDVTGRQHALRLQAALAEKGRSCRIRWASRDPLSRIDPADDVTADFSERVAILEVGGLDREAACRQAWRDLQPLPGRDDP